MDLRFQLLFIFSFVCLFFPHPSVILSIHYFFMALLVTELLTAHNFFYFSHHLITTSPSYTLGQDWEGQLSCLDTEHQPRNSRVNVFLTRWSNAGRQVDPEVVDFIPGLMHWCLQNTSSCLNVCLQKYVRYRECLCLSLSPPLSLFPLPTPFISKLPT